MTQRLTPEQKAWRSISEREWQAQVIRLAFTRGWKYYHAPDNKPINGRIQKVVPGFPDLVLVKDGNLIFAELKKETGKTSPEQDAWLEALSLCGNKCYVWRPSQLREVVGVLEQKL
jgi:hypothetical protein